MSEIFKLFDGNLNAGGAAGVTTQNASSFSNISSENDLISTLSTGTDSVQLKVDYSDLSNFVTFNSAESYATVTADQILNSYPAGGTVDDLQQFINSLDGYQQYFLNLWPSTLSHLRLNPAISSSYVRIDDFGIQDGVSKTSFLSPGTGSFSIQGWIDVPALTGSNDVQVIFQKQKVGSSDGYSVFTSGSSIFFQVISGSTTVTVSGTTTSMPSFFAATVDRTSLTGSTAMYIGTAGIYPVLTDSSNIIIGTRYDLVSGSFFIGSGSIASKIVRPFTGSLDNISAWSIAKTKASLSGTYNRKIFAQSGLIAAWRFNDAFFNTPSSVASIVRDNSGHRLNGRIQSFFSGSRGSGSLVNESADPVLSLYDPNVVYYVVGAQVTGALYDRNNESMIFKMFPGIYSEGNKESSDTFKNFALILARHFDRIKLYINQLVNLRRVEYGSFDQAPDELLDEVGRFFGWDLHGSFANIDAMKYFIGRDVQTGPNGNIGLTTKLSSIKTAFWRRTILNLVYLYKTKGTRESVESLLRSYGLDNGFVRLKEYARKTEARLPVSRIVAEKSAYSLRIPVGSELSFIFSSGTVNISTGSLGVTLGTIGLSSTGIMISLITGTLGSTFGSIALNATGSVPTLVSIAVSPSPGVMTS